MLKSTCRFYANWPTVLKCGPTNANGIILSPPAKGMFVNETYFILLLHLQIVPQGRRLFIISTTSNRSILTDLGLAESFDAELRVPPISTLGSLVYVLDEVELFRDRAQRDKAIGMLQQAGFDNHGDETSSRLNIGIKKLLSVIEMSRQEPEAVAERLTTSLMGLGM